jgi:hypothetical protein
LAFGGFLLTGALIALGGVWPSYFTIAALISLLAPVLFLVALVRPALFDRKGVRAYLLLSVVLAAVSVGYFVLGMLVSYLDGSLTYTG